ncbi:hypothetical protein ABWH96_02445 [Marivirga tractuosa]|uniref:hypothetical protein n=1 Tax=Marivirga tractuosa TaxID=1006 RepID=UPI0035D117F4
MPKFDLLLLPLLGGFWFLNIFNYTKYYHQRIERQRLIFNSSIVAIFLSALGLLIDGFFPEVNNLLSNLVPFNYSGFNQSLLIFLISPVFAILLNLIPRRFLLQLAINKHGDQIENIFWESLIQKNDNDKLLMITTNFNKIYVGYVKTIQKPIGDSFVTLLPYFSGYRNKDTQELEITTDYFSIIKKMIEDKKLDEIDKKLGVTLHKSDVTLVSKFDQSVFDRFNKSDEVEVDDLPY